MRKSPKTRQQRRQLREIELARQRLPFQYGSLLEDMFNSRPAPTKVDKGKALRLRRHIKKSVTPHAKNYRLELETIWGKGYCLEFRTLNTPVALELETDLKRFWREFVKGRPPIVAFSNNIFIQFRNGILKPPSDGSEQSFARPNVTWLTGVGEVVGAVELERVFAKLGARADFIAGWGADFDDRHKRHVIYLGSPFTNSSLLDQESSGFQFTVKSTRQTVSYEVRSPSGDWFTRKLVSEARSEWIDYAVIAHRSKAGGAHDLLLAGTTSFGTAACAQYVVDPSNVRALLANAQGLKNHFDLLLKVPVVRGHTSLGSIEVVEFYLNGDKTDWIQATSPIRRDGARKS